MQLFDRHLLRKRRDRAAAGFVNHNFLVQITTEEIAGRLSFINRPFRLALDLGCRGGTLCRQQSALDQTTQWFRADISRAALKTFPAPPAFVADEERLPVRDSSLCLVTSVLSLHWANDLPGVLVQIRRALRPDGLFMGALFGGKTLWELREAISAAEIECHGGLSPRISPFTQIRDLGSLLQRAGFALPVADTDTIHVHYPSALHLMRELRGMGETNLLQERRKIPMTRQTLLRASEIYQERFQEKNGTRVQATFEILYMTGWAPHKSQQKPLRPGSARTPLSEALGKDIPSEPRATAGTKDPSDNTGNAG